MKTKFEIKCVGVFLHSVLAYLLFMPVAYGQVAQNLPFEVKAVTAFDEPWAMAFLSDGRMLVTEKKGSLLLVDQGGRKQSIRGVPDVSYGGQGGLGDVAIHPDFGNNGWVYLSFVEAGHHGTRGAAVGRGKLNLEGRRPVLNDFEILWRQYPKLVGFGHYGHRLMFDEQGFLWITSGDRQKFTPAQDMQSNIGKVLRLNDDGSVPADNPYVDYTQQTPLAERGGVYDQVWSLGHRNPLGIVQDEQANIWVIEMGPRDGDELNLIREGKNYGYPEVSDGKHYDGRPIPNHDTRPEFETPKISWVPAISPGHLSAVKGIAFADWKGNLLASGLGSQALVRIELNGDTAKEVERFDMETRIRSALEGPDGAIWVLEDERGDSHGRLLKLTPR